MKLALALLLNGLLLAWLLPWLRRQWRQAPAPAWRWALGLGLGGRLLVGGFGSIHLIKDADYMSQLARLLTAQLWAEPARAWHTFAGNELHFGASAVVYYGMSNTFFLAKLLAVLNLGSGGVSWLNGLYLALAAFVGGWAAARSLARAWPAWPAAAGLGAFLGWPSVVWFGSGVNKETALLATGAGVLALFVTLVYGRGTSAEKIGGWRRLALLAALVVLAVLHFKLRYFLAAPLLALLAGVAGLRALHKAGLGWPRWAQALLLLGWLWAGAWLASEVSVAFRLNKFTNQLTLIYARHLRASANRPHFEYPDLRPTPESILRHAPLAACNALARPWLGETEGRPLYVAGALETSGLVLLLIFALASAGHRDRWPLPFAFGLALGLHCLIFAVLLGLSTPNLGSLARYRAALLPPLLLLLLPPLMRAVKARSAAKELP